MLSSHAPRDYEPLSSVPPAPSAPSRQSSAMARHGELVSPQSSSWTDQLSHWDTLSEAVERLSSRRSLSEIPVMERLVMISYLFPLDMFMGILHKLEEEGSLRDGQNVHKGKILNKSKKPPSKKVKPDYFCENISTISHSKTTVFPQANKHKLQPVFVDVWFCSQCSLQNPELICEHLIIAVLKRVVPELFRNAMNDGISANNSLTNDSSTLNTTVTYGSRAGMDLTFESQWREEDPGATKVVPIAGMAGTACPHSVSVDEDANVSYDGEDEHEDADANTSYERDAAYENFLLSVFHLSHLPNGGD